MKRIMGSPLLSLTLAVVASLGAWSALAQPPGGFGPGFGGGRGGPMRMPPFPVMQALDANGDGELSAPEIDNASKALRTLDKDKNGKLSADELRPNFERFGPGGPGGPGGGQNPEALVNQMMTFDKNGDGKLAKDEIPERLQAVLSRADTNKDGVVDRAELTELARQRSGRGGPGGPGGEFRGREGGEGFGPGGRERRRPEGGNEQEPKAAPKASRIS